MNVFETRLLKVLGDISSSLKSIDRKLTGQVRTHAEEVDALKAEHALLTLEAQMSEAMASMKSPNEYK